MLAKSFPIWLFCVLPLAAARYVPPATDRAWTDLSDQPWKFIGSNALAGAEAIGYDDASWASVKVPHTWNAKADRATYTNAWYRTHFIGASADTAGGKRCYLRFDAVNANADVYLNGSLLGKHAGGYTAFLFDATAARKDGDNVLAVKVDNANHPGLPSNGNGWVHYGGIIRKVRMLRTGPYAINPAHFASPGIYLSQTEVGAAGASLSARVMLRNASGSAKTLAVALVVCDSSDGIVATWRDSLAVPAKTDTALTLAGDIANPHLWSLESPYLYRVYAEVRVDGSIADLVAQRTGFRSYALTPSAFTINGEAKPLRGAGMHAENEAAYNALDSLAIRKQFDVAQDLGMNYLRLVHYPHASAAYSLADERGIGISAEDGLYQNNSDVGSAQRDDNVREMVLQNYNHPSILWWGAGNEDYFNANIVRFGKVIQATDSTRPVFYASSGQNPSGGVDFVFQNIYQGWYSGAIKDFPAGNHWISETGAGGTITTHQDYKSAKFTVGSFEPEEYEDLALEHKFEYIFDTKPADVPLYSHWVLFDMGDSKYKGLNSKGILTAGGYPKDPYWLWKAKARPSEPVIRICGKHWYLRADSRDIKVYANRPSLALTVNGAGRGTKADGAYLNPSTGGVIHDVFYFDSVLQKGKNTVIASDGAGHADTAVIYFTGTAPAAPADTGEPISSLASANSANPAYLINQPIQAQWPAYYQCDGNADNSFDTIPALLAGARWIATRRQSQTATGLSFAIGDRAGADVYILATKQTTVPAWITSAGFMSTGVSGMWRDNNMNPVAYEVYGKSFAAGAAVSLAGSAIDFVVLVKSAGPTGLGPRAEGIAIAHGYAFLSAAKRFAVPRMPGGLPREVAIYDLSGNCVKKARLAGDQGVFDAGDAAGAGIHIIRIRTP